MPAKNSNKSGSEIKPYPLFYACYLLKSIKTPRSVATYIGSTPNPPRRLRQHNGEITQGAWKTRLSRPWVMQLIVFGFQSKLAALQFEWAWQHPQRSRHLRSSDGEPIIASKSKHLKNNALVVRTMVSHTPYNKWPLHVKIFTNEALKSWQAASKAIEDLLPLPPGLTVYVELEGVDGKSGEIGSGRKGPIDVLDEVFTAAHLAKQSKLLAQSRYQVCTICHEDIDLAIEDTLLTCLCPIVECVAVSHVLCLKTEFLSYEDGLDDDDAELLPRGGTCQECKTYVLWGDIIRGSHRRKYAGRAAIISAEEEEEKETNVSEESLLEDDAKIVEVSNITQKRKGKIGSQSRPEHGRRRRQIRAKEQSARNPESEGEFFDLDNVSELELSNGNDKTEKRQRKPTTTEQLLKPSPKMRRSNLHSASFTSRPSKLASSGSSHSILPHINSSERSFRKKPERFKIDTSSSESSNDQPLAYGNNHTKNSKLTSSRPRGSEREITNVLTKQPTTAIPPLLLARAKAQNLNRGSSEGIINENSASLEIPMRELSHGFSSLSVVSSISDPSCPGFELLNTGKPFTDDEIIVISD